MENNKGIPHDGPHFLSSAGHKSTDLLIAPPLLLLFSVFITTRLSSGDLINKLQMGRKSVRSFGKVESVREVLESVCFWEENAAAYTIKYSVWLLFTQIPDPVQSNEVYTNKDGFPCEITSPQLLISWHRASAEDYLPSEEDTYLLCGCLCFNNGARPHGENREPCLYCHWYCTYSNILHTKNQCFTQICNLILFCWLFSWFISLFWLFIYCRKWQGKAADPHITNKCLTRLSKYVVGNQF